MFLEPLKGNDQLFSSYTNFILVGDVTEVDVYS